MEEEIRLKPIGIIHTPFKELKDIPIQSKFGGEIKGTIKLFKEYEKGLKDLNGFSHLILIYYFDKSKRESLVDRPYFESNEHGIFAIRSPHRPNHIGFSIVKTEKIRNNMIFFREVDMLDGTPLLDIKPYISRLDSRENVKNGWIDKHLM